MIGVPVPQTIAVSDETELLDAAASVGIPAC